MSFQIFFCKLVIVQHICTTHIKTSKENWCISFESLIRLSWKKIFLMHNTLNCTEFKILTSWNYIVCIFEDVHIVALLFKLSWANSEGINLFYQVHLHLFWILLLLETYKIFLLIPFLVKLVCYGRLGKTLQFFFKKRNNSVYYNCNIQKFYFTYYFLDNGKKNQYGGTMKFFEIIHNILNTYTYKE